MAATVRQPKPTKKSFPGDNPSTRRQAAWGGARSSPSFSPSPNNARLPNGPPPAASTQAASFPPLGPATPTPRQDHRTVLQNLASLTGTTVTFLTKTAKRYEGVIVSTTESEGDTTGVTLRDVRELTNPGAPVKNQLFIASTNIDSWSPVPANVNSSGQGPLNASSRVDGKLLQTLAGLTGTTITLSTKTGKRYEGVIASTAGERSTPGLTLRDAKELSAPGAPLKDHSFIPTTDIDTWSSGPADVKVPNGDSFKTDTDISQKAPRRERERELQAWQADLPQTAVGPPGTAHGQHNDDVTFGAGSSGHAGWNQFSANEKLFGVRTGFDEELYTTKLDRSGADFAEREKRAQALANEIMRGATNNPHILEERVMNNADNNSGVNEEDKYGAVARGPNAYVPPGARRSIPSVVPPVAAAPIAAPSASTSANVKGPDVPKVSINAPDGSTVTHSDTTTPAPSPSPVPSASASQKPPADALPAFREFVTHEKQRLTQKRQALVKSERDKRMAELLKFSQNFKLNKPIPDDLVKIIAKDEEKQRAIVEKSTKDAASAQARSIGATAALSATPVTNPPVPATSSRVTTSTSGNVSGTSSSSSKLASSPSVASTKTHVTAPTKGGRISMVIQSIPPFKGKKSQSASQSPNAATLVTTKASGSGTTKSAESAKLVDGAVNKLNVNATSFRPNPKALAFTPASPNTTAGASANSSPKTKPEGSSASPPTPNPFFGKVALKKTPVHVKDDFNPFKFTKVAEASAVNAIWPYQGKRYMQMFPPVQAPPPQQSPHMVPPGPPPIPPPPYEEDQSIPRGYVYAYPPYAYPGQPMMPGMAPPPPGAYIPGPFMQPMPYPPNMPPPNAMYASPQMGQMPPPQAYMQAPPPGQYPPPPNGAGPRPSMPPTPIPAHAHPYYHQSPQLPQAVPYPMMMPPPGGPGGPPHGYEGGPAPPVSMGGVGHA